MSTSYNNPFVAYIQIEIPSLDIKCMNSLAENILCKNKMTPRNISELDLLSPFASEKNWTEFLLNQISPNSNPNTIQNPNGDQNQSRQQSQSAPTMSQSVQLPELKDHPGKKFNFFAAQTQKNLVELYLSEDFATESQNLKETITAEQKKQMALRIELQMSDIALERKSYELKMIRELIGQIKRIQDYDEIILVFMRFICEKFLMGNAFFIKLFIEKEQIRGHVASTFSMLESPPLGGLRQKIYSVINENPDFYTGPKKYLTKNIPAQVVDYFNIEGRTVTGLLTLPISFGKKLIGTLQIAHYDPHHGLTEEDIDFIGLLLEQIDPFVENSKLFEMSMVDDLTQVFNKRFFKMTLEKEYKKGKEFPDQNITLILLDIDFFKKINDSFGHLAGDKVLQEFAKILKSSVRDKDIVCRYGGEEFAIILSEPVEIAIKMAERIQNKLHKTLMQMTDNVQKSITASLGIASLNAEKILSPEMWIEAADQSLYEAKKTGRDKYVVHTFK